MADRARASRPIRVTAPKHLWFNDVYFADQEIRTCDRAQADRRGPREDEAGLARVIHDLRGWALLGWFKTGLVTLRPA